MYRRVFGAPYASEGCSRRVLALDARDDTGAFVNKASATQAGRGMACSSALQEFLNGLGQCFAPSVRQRPGFEPDHRPAPAV